MRKWITVLASVLVILGPGMLARGGSHAFAQTGGWATMAPLPLAKTGLVAVTGTNGLIYAFGGTDNATQDYADAEVYDPSSNVWRGIAPLPVAESYASAILGLDGKIYIFGGFNSISGQSLNNVFAYDPSTGTYACSTNYPGCSSASLAPMPTARSVMAITETSDGNIWTIGGYTSTPVATVEIYDPASNTWTEGPDLPTPESGASAEALPTRDVIVWGGFDGQTHNSSTFLLALPAPGPSPSMDILTAAGRSLRSNADAPSIIRAQPNAAPRAPATRPYWCKYPPPQRANELKWLVKGGVYAELEKKLGSSPAFIFKWVSIFLFPRDKGGNALGLELLLEAYIANECHDVSSYRGEARRLGPAEAPHQTPASVQLPPIVYAGGATTSGISTSVSVYDWLTDNWTSGPPLPSPREAAASTYGPNGTDYVIGGDDGTNVYNTVFAYTAPMLTLNLAAAPTSTPTQAPAASTNTPTSTPVPPTPTTTPIPLFVSAKIGHKSVAPGKKQTITVRTLPGARVSIAISYPSGKKKHHHATAGSSGTTSWSFKQASGLTRGSKRTAKVTIAVVQDGVTVTAHRSYTIG